MKELNFSPDILIEHILSYAPKVLGAIVVLMVGLWIVKLFSNLIGKVIRNSIIDDSLEGFLISLISILLKIMVYISSIGMLGIEMTSFIAILGAAGLAVGMALSGTLQNFAGGVMILLFKPFKVGDYISAQGHSGSVKEIQIFVTQLATPDNKTIFIPNGPLANDSLINFSAQETRRVEWVFSISYGDDVEVAFEVLRTLLVSDDRILNDPEPFMALSKLAESSVDITVRVWVKGADYWSVYYRMNEEVYKNFSSHGLRIPFPQTEVHIHI
jgi:small conductance mechanosensitive channel